MYGLLSKSFFFLKCKRLTYLLTDKMIYSGALLQKSWAV